MPNIKVHGHGSVKPWARNGGSVPLACRAPNRFACRCIRRTGVHGRRARGQRL